MTTVPGTVLLRYGAALVLTGIATAFIYSLKPFLAHGMVLYIPAITASAWSKVAQDARCWVGSR